jgi:hypothetical protein
LESIEDKGTFCSTGNLRENTALLTLRARRYHRIRYVAARSRYWYTALPAAPCACGNPVSCNIRVIIRVKEIGKLLSRLFGKTHLKPWFRGEYDDEMPAETRSLLTDLYQPHNRRLFSLIGREFDW